MHTISKINDLLIIEIEDFLSDKEIDTILIPRKNKFKTAIDQYPQYYRNNDRLVEDNEQLSAKLFSQLEDLRIISQETNYKATGINERIRFCKYQKNQLFSKHQDGVYYPNDEQESKFTFLLYLNNTTAFDGGETLFYSSKTDLIATKRVMPKKGKLIIFDHTIWHQGAKVSKGNKYILRSDIFVEQNRKTTHHNGYIWNLLKLNNDEFLSCGRDTNIKHWNTDLILQNTFKIHTKSVLTMIRLNKEEFISCSRDFTIKKWRLSGEILCSTNVGEMIISMLTMPNTTIIAVGTSGKVFVLNSSLKLLKSLEVHSGWIWGVSILSNTTIITCSEDGSVYTTNLLTNSSECLYKGREPLFCVNSDHRNIVLIGTKKGELIQVYLDTRRYTKTKIHNDIIRSIIYYKKRILTCGEDNKVMSINYQLGNKIEILKSTNFIQDIIGIKDSIYAAGYDGTIMVSNNI